MKNFEKTAKISSKGQITLPKVARSALGTDSVRIVVEDGQVRLEPVPDLAGSLSQYADKYIPFEVCVHPSLLK